MKKSKAIIDDSDSDECDNESQPDEDSDGNEVDVEEPGRSSLPSESSDKRARSSIVDLLDDDNRPSDKRRSSWNCILFLVRDVYRQRLEDYTKKGDRFGGKWRWK